MTHSYTRALRHFVAAVLVAFAAIIMLDSCSTTQRWADEEPAAFSATIAGEGVQLLDVRHPDEYFEGHLAGARNIDVQATDGPDFVTRAAAVLNRRQPVAVYCRSGRRSALAAQQLARAGYKVTNLAGGIIAWQVAGLPVTK